MNLCKKLLFGLALALQIVAAQAASGGIAWDKAPVKTNDQSSLQHGAKIFVNYCLNCHSASFMRYNRLRDIGLTEQQIKDNLLFTTEKVGDTMKAAIDPQQAKAWFGANPPDLTLIARSRAGAGGSGRRSRARGRNSDRSTWRGRSAGNRSAPAESACGSSPDQAGQRAAARRGLVSRTSGAARACRRRVRHR